MFLHALLRAEIAEVPGDARNVVLGGLGQGCAASLVAMLLWEGPPLGAVVGMCGWLPFVGRLDEEVEGVVSGGGSEGGDEGEEMGRDGEDDFSLRERRWMRRGNVTEG